jgi:hypothetical protein
MTIHGLMDLEDSQVYNCFYHQIYVAVSARCTFTKDAYIREGRELTYILDGS